MFTNFYYVFFGLYPIYVEVMLCTNLYFKESNIMTVHLSKQMQDSGFFFLNISDICDNDRCTIFSLKDIFLEHFILLLDQSTDIHENVNDLGKAIVPNRYTSISVKQITTHHTKDPISHDVYRFITSIFHFFPLQFVKAHQISDFRLFYHYDRKWRISN